MKIECLSDDEQHEPTAGVCAVPHLLICLDDRCCRVVVMVAVLCGGNAVVCAAFLAWFVALCCGSAGWVGCCVVVVWQEVAPSSK